MRVAGLLCALALAACGGPRVRPLSVSDPRLPADARRWIADAEDAVVAARARASDADAERAAARAYLGRVEEAASTLAGVAEPLRRLAEARRDHADAEADVAGAELGLADARREEAMAETAMRHDVAVYDLAPIAADVEGWRGRAAAARDARQQRRDALEAATQAFWQAWRQYAAGGGDTRVLWRDLRP